MFFVGDRQEMRVAKECRSPLETNLVLTHVRVRFPDIPIKIVTHICQVASISTFVSVSDALAAAEWGGVCPVLQLFFLSLLAADRDGF